MMIFKRFFALTALAVASLGTLSGAAQAGGLCADFILTCENGRTYPFCPRAISEAGDIVTGNLVTGPHSSVHMRLIPMGIGYRYAGKGIWFDGFESAAALYFDKNAPLACTVSRRAGEPPVTPVLYTKY
ncbi:MAG: hypothetical protein NVV83_14205 [Afipia sp.]|jgi:hypothetical protein|nr:hypothetical protein [Afipia sp.]